MKTIESANTHFSHQILHHHHVHETEGTEHTKSTITANISLTKLQQVPAADRVHEDGRLHQNSSQCSKIKDQIVCAAHIFTQEQRILIKYHTVKVAKKRWSFGLETLDTPRKEKHRVEGASLASPLEKRLFCYPPCALLWQATASFPQMPITLDNFRTQPFLNHCNVSIALSLRMWGTNLVIGSSANLSLPLVTCYMLVHLLYARFSVNRRLICCI